MFCVANENITALVAGNLLSIENDKQRTIKPLNSNETRKYNYVLTIQMK